MSFHQHLNQSESSFSVVPRLFGALVPKLILFFFLLAFSLMPLYVFPSGIPQPADIVFFLFSFLLLSAQVLGKEAGRIKASSKKVVACLFFFVAWISFVSLGNSLFFQSIDILYSSSFYVFNFIIFLSLLSAAAINKEEFRNRLTLALVLASSVLFALLLLGFASGAARQTAGFNNPNQLGYFSLLLGCCAVVIFNKKDSMILFSCVMLVAFLGVLASSSLSALIAFSFIPFAVAIKYFRRGAAKKFLLTVFIFSLSLPAFYTSSLGKELDQQWQLRFSMLERKTENVSESRGYDRIWDHKEYLIFGAGERGRWRFNPQHSFELHSSLGTILFSYGVVGLLLFSIFIFFVFKGACFYSVVLFCAPMVYSLTHQGLRTTLFWVFLALVLLYGQKDHLFREGLKCQKSCRKQQPP